ncbi:MAG: queuosine precursor transporter [Planctomycetota bacterium]
MPGSIKGSNPVPASVLHRRRERVFLVMAGLFLGTLAMLNILGISRFIVLASSEGGSVGNFFSTLEWGTWGKISFALAVGVLPYPLTFLCTDLISEFYGRRRANFVVWVGLILNFWIIFILWLGGTLPMQPEMVSYGFDAAGNEVFAPPSPEPIYDEQGNFVRFSEDWTFYRIQQLAFGAVIASMIAYMVAQFVDVQLFHFWKRLTKGKHLWLRNNGSTLVSQLVDTTAVILITHFYAKALPVNVGEAIWPQLLLFIATGYAFKMLVALLDTPIIYLAVAVLRRYLRLDPVSERQTDADERSLYANQET